MIGLSPTNLVKIATTLGLITTGANPFARAGFAITVRKSLPAVELTDTVAPGSFPHTPLTILLAGRPLDAKALGEARASACKRHPMTPGSGRDSLNHTTSSLPQSAAIGSYFFRGRSAHRPAL